MYNLIGNEASSKIMKAVKPKTFTDYSYDELITLCKSLFGVQKNSIVEHFKFINRFQAEGESHEDFALECQALAEYCEFGAFLDTAFRDRFVVEIRNNRTKKVLLGLSNNKKFNEVVDAAKKGRIITNRVGENAD